MALKYFRGRLDLAKLSLQHLADAAAALNALERLAEIGVIAFETGASRQGAPRPDVAGGRGYGRPQLQKDILDALHEAGGALKYPDLRAATGMKDGSLSANLTLLEREGMIAKTMADRPKGTVGRISRNLVTFSLVKPMDIQ